ncbi:HAD family hydrolase [Rheinheimera sp. 4Y26]|uniref:HAD family hydrolase n=1 Tax=Rheinheimera sp. 4Y26 TaxID=2977811 RepID=UPI0021B1304A|nr:HAD-IA family hydrolase [Rheinheimera sp. 4Y26]MCT6699371.1 HAD-IA family hydrolase [Rheinheimera sp. 4Y26]
MSLTELRLPHGLLFDLDGTLVDTADDLGAALNYVLALHRMPLCRPEQYRPVASHGAKGLLELGFGEALGNFDFFELRSLLLQYYAAHICDHSQLFAGGAALIQALNKQQIPWGIVTNKPYKLAASMLRQLPGLAGCGILLGGDSLGVRKPDPTPLLIAAHQLKVPARQCWYVGDAERDIEAGRRAGMTTVLAGFGYIGASDQPELWQANLRIEQLSELINYLPD